MNTISNKSLFWLAAKKEYQDNRKLILWGCFGWLALCLISGSLFGLFGIMSASSELAIYCVLANLSGCVGASLAFSDLKQKEGRIAALMTPAKAIHKFLPRFLAMVVGIYVIFFIGYFVTDYARVIINNIVNEETAEPLHISFDLSKYQVAAIVGSVVATLLGQAFYLLGGVLAPKVSFFKTTAVLFLAEIILGSIYGSIKDTIYISIDISPLAFLYSVYSVMFAITVLLWWCAYRAFKRCKVTPFMIRIGKYRYEF